MRRAAFIVPMRASSWTLAVPQGGFVRLRFVSGEPHTLAARGLRFQLHRARGRAPALEQGLDEPGSSGAASARWGGRSFASGQAPAWPARRPSAAAPTHPPALPREGSESPSAVSVACHFVRMRRPRRASSGTPARQGRALRVAVGQPGLGGLPLNAKALHPLRHRCMAHRLARRTSCHPPGERGTSQ